MGLHSLFAQRLNRKLYLFRKLHFFLPKPNTIEQTRKIISASVNDTQIYSLLNPRIYEIIWLIVNTAESYFGIIYRITYPISYHLHLYSILILHTFITTKMVNGQNVPTTKAWICCHSLSHPQMLNDKLLICKFSKTFNVHSLHEEVLWNAWNDFPNCCKRK